MEFDYKKNQTSLHEAAHAFVAWYFGGRIIMTTITGPTDENEPEHLRTFCYVYYYPPESKSPDRLTGDDIFFRIIVSLAPYAVEKKFIGKASPGCLYDIQKAVKFLSPAYEDPEIRSLVKDAHKVFREILNKNSSWEDAALEFYRKRGKPVKEFFDQEKVETAVKALTQHISAKGRLSGFETVSFLESIWDGQLPEKAKPAYKHSTDRRGGTLGNTLASTSRLLELIRHNLNDNKPANEFEEKILEKVTNLVLQPLFQIKELQSKLHYEEVRKNGRRP